jgi:hypothetical protein
MAPLPRSSKLLAIKVELHHEILSTAFAPIETLVDSDSSAPLGGRLSTGKNSPNLLS